MPKLLGQQKHDNMDAFCVFVLPSATMLLWRPDWSRQLQTNSSPAGPGASRGHWCHSQTDEGCCIAPRRRKITIMSVNLIFRQELVWPLNLVASKYLKGNKTEQRRVLLQLHKSYLKVILLDDYLDYYLTCRLGFYIKFPSQMLECYSPVYVLAAFWKIIYSIVFLSIEVL